MADIVNTIIVRSSVRSVAVLGAIVVLRTVLSLSLDVEIDGTLPWRRQTGPMRSGEQVLPQPTSA